MKTLFAILFFVGMFAVVMTTDTLANGDGFLFWIRDPDDEKIHWNWPGWRRFLRCLGVAAVTTVIREGSHQMSVLLEANPTMAIPAWWPWVLVAGLLLMVALMVNMAIWWNVKTGARLRELLLFLLNVGIFSTVASQVAAIFPMAYPSMNPFLASAIALLPNLIGGAVNALLIIEYFFYLAQTAEKKGARKACKVIAWILAVCAAIGIILSLIFGLNWPKKERKIENPNTSTETETRKPVETQTPPTAPKWNYVHDAVLLDNYDADGNELEGEALANAKLNDYNFGADPVMMILTDKMAAGELNLNDFAQYNEEKDILKLLSVENVHNQFVADLRAGDPSLLAGDAAYWSYKMGSSFAGEWFSDVDGTQRDAWMKAINHASISLSADEAAYYENAEKFIRRLENANAIFLEYRPNGIVDQMYMLSGELGELPEVVAMKSPNHSGVFITYRYVIKETLVIDISYRVYCRWQPCNVEEMNVTVEENPVKSSTPSKQSSGGTRPQQDSQGGNTPQQQQGTKGGATPQQQNTQGGGILQQQPECDITQGVGPAQDVLPNDDPGILGDEPTMSDEDPYHSTAEVPMNSGNGMNVAGNRILTEDLADANRIYRQRDDTPDAAGNYKPTYQPVGEEAKDGGPTFYSNESKGTGSGGVDVITPVDQSATGSIVGNNGNDTSQTGTATNGVNLFWGADMSQ